jgi:hypothetical protein
MVSRILAFALVLVIVLVAPARAQQAFDRRLVLGDSIIETSTPLESAWIDLRQIAAANAKVQSAPSWVEAVTLTPGKSDSPIAVKSVFRIRVSRPKKELNALMFRLFFDDNPKAQPEIVVWDESGTQVVRSGPLGAGLNLPTSETVVIPMINVTALDVEVPGDGSTIRGVYIDWMTSSEVVHPLHGQLTQIAPQPFSAGLPLHTAQNDTEIFGTVTAPLAIETVPMGPSIQQSAPFQFGLESMPLLALLTFEVASPKIEAPPNIYLNGEDIGPVTLVLPDLADPGYRGEMRTLVRKMQYRYTGWVRAQKLLPVSRLKVGTNDLIVVAGNGTAVSAIRATQVQLKYLWEKSDYVLKPEKSLYENQ